MKVNVTGIFQEVYLDGQQYINLIEFTIGSGVKGVAAVTGRYRVEDSKRLNIDFLETSVKSASNDLDVFTFRSCLGIDSQSALESKLDFSGWSDITYLDENLRLMRGNNQNLYVLVRTN